MHVLVTGASGFVGGAVSRALVAAGHDVVGFVRSAGSADELKAAGVRPVTGDMRRPDDYVPLVADVDAVVHAAQLEFSGRFTDPKAAQLREADRVMGDALAGACQSAGKRLLYTSCGFCYGDHGGEWITEETPFTPSPLGVAHAAGVTRLRRRVADGLDAVVLCPGFVYGPGGQFAEAFYDQARQGRLRVIGIGDNWWSVVHVDDLAAAYVAALERAPAGAEYNVVDGSPLTLRTMVDQLMDGLGRSRVGTIPPMVIGLIIGRPLVDSLLTSFRIGNEKVRAELGWQPRYATFADGLPETLAALRGSR